ncbi:MAG: hybrid sensor histidine kinase/response regulator, partial [Alphaproteobacteria bacterium]|nr:hybrid sensor histidine kinase/response regulator [Alphaproteobacteria bacterium]
MDDLLREFLTESNESLATLDQELVKLERNPNDPGLLSNIFRLVHTIKGTCGFLGLPRLETTAHAAENVLGKLRDGELEVTPVAVTLILESLDRIKMLLASLEEAGVEPEGNDDVLKQRLNAFAEGRAEASVAVPPAAPPVPQAAAAPASVVAPRAADAAP